MATTINVEVCSDKQVLATIDVEQYDNVAEAVEKLGEALALEMINVQYKTRQMNTVRRQKTGKLSKEEIRALAMSRITPDEFMAAQGDETRFAALIAAKVAAVEAEIEAKKPTKVESTDDAA